MGDIRETSVITKARRVLLTQITSGAISTISPIKFMSFGDGGCDEEGNAIRPSELQTELVNQVGIYPIDSVTYPDEVTARYTATIPENDLVGKKISELALVSEDGVIHAIQTTYPKQKDSGAKFTFEFEDEFKEVITNE